MRPLIRHFRRSLLVSDLTPASGDPRVLLVTAAALFGVPAFPLLVFIDFFRMAGATSAPVLVFYAVLSAVLAGLAATAIWDNLLPGRTDHQILGPLPLARGSIALARLLAIAWFLAIFEALVNLLSSVCLPVFFTPDNAGVAGLARHMAGQAAATVGLSLWVFLMLLALKCLVTLVFGENSAIGNGARMLVLTALVVALVLSPDLIAPEVFYRLVHSTAAWTLPVRAALALVAAVQGTRPLAGTAGLAGFGLRMLGETALAALGLYWLAAWRQARTAFTSRPPKSVRAGGHGLAAALGHYLVRRPAERTLLEFAAKTLRRSRPHAAALTAWIAVGIGFAAGNVGWLVWSPRYGRPGIEAALLAVPLAISFFLIFGLRHVITIPVEPSAIWVFRLSEQQPGREWLGITWKLMAAVGLVPLLALDAPLAVMALGPRAGLEQALLLAAMALLLVELSLVGFARLPLVSAHAETLNLKFLWPVFFVAYEAYVGVSAWESDWLAQPGKVTVIAAMLFAATAALAIVRRRALRQTESCEFAASPDALVQAFMTAE